MLEDNFGSEYGRKRAEGAVRQKFGTFGWLLFTKRISSRVLNQPSVLNFKQVCGSQQTWSYPCHDLGIRSLAADSQSDQGFQGPVSQVGSGW